jgi:hypothetical protein
LTELAAGYPQPSFAMLRSPPLNRRRPVLAVDWANR